MIVLSWNCRGLGNPRAVRSLCFLVKEKRPDLVFLMETKLNKKRDESIRCKLGFDQCFVVECIGKSGGLMLLWRNQNGVEIQNYSQSHINAVVRCKHDDSPWKLTGFYGNPDTARRNESWALLWHLSTLQPNPWMCVGDFNEITSASEKSSRTLRPSSQMAEFRRELEDSSC